VKVDAAEGANENANGALRAASVKIRAHGDRAGIYVYGMEFLEADNMKDFWDITFPL
jgi:hypothetical protein